MLAEERNLIQPFDEIDVDDLNLDTPFFSRGDETSAGRERGHESQNPNPCERLELEFESGRVRLSAMGRLQSEMADHIWYSQSTIYKRECPRTIKKPGIITAM